MAADRVCPQCGVRVSHKNLARHLEKVHAGKSTGRVKWYSVQKGFGFITSDSGGKDLLVSHRTLFGGQRVEFKEVLDENGPIAVDVCVILEDGKGPEFAALPQVPDPEALLKVESLMRLCKKLNPEETRILHSLPWYNLEALSNCRSDDEQLRIFKGIYEDWKDARRPIVFPRMRVSDSPRGRENLSVKIIYNEPPKAGSHSSGRHK